MLVSAKEMLDKAKAGHYAVGQFNINNLEWTKSILLTAQELKSPVILGVSEGAGKYMTGFKTVAAMVKAMDEELGITVPVALHLDHGTYEGCYKCIKAGFTSIMFDGSHYPIEENVEKTKELVTVAHQLGLSIEAEVGSIGGEEDGVVGMGECADPNECKAIADLGVDMLAAGIGNIHGKYPANWPGLSFETLAAVQEKTGALPLVLHGGTGIPEDMIKKAIELGVSKINVNTECQLSFADATRKYIEGLDIHHMYKTREERREKVEKILAKVGLAPEHAERYPHQFSGGQRQRVGIARALIMNPKLIIADECISALDVSIQAQVVNLMKDIQQETGTAYLFIAHDLSMVKYISDRIGVLHLGHLLETGTTEEIFENPIHPYTRSLLSAIPLPNPVVEKRRVAETYDYATSGIDYNKGTDHHVSGSHYVKCTDEEFAKWCR